MAKEIFGAELPTLTLKQMCESMSYLQLEVESMIRGSGWIKTPNESELACNDTIQKAVNFAKHPSRSWYDTHAENHPKIQVELVRLLRSAMTVALTRDYTACGLSRVLLDAWHPVTERWEDGASAVTPVGQVATGEFLDIEVLLGACQECGMELVDIYRIFAGECTLIRFRHVHGFGREDGGYVQIWGKELDSDAMRRFIHDHPTNMEFEARVWDNLREAHAVAAEETKTKFI